MREGAGPFNYGLPNVCPYADRGWLAAPNALVQLQARYNHRGEAASEKCLSAATFVRWPLAGRLGDAQLNTRTNLPRLATAIERVIDRFVASASRLPFIGEVDSHGYPRHSAANAGL